MSELHCPECGHYIGNLTQGAAPGTSVQADDLAPRVLEWINWMQIDGRMRASEARSAFETWHGDRVSHRTFGMALRQVGVKQRKSQGARYWYF